MKALAPGKLVLSGAYSVLEGAPAIVTAVDRYAEADSARPAEWLTPEVRAALGDRGPWFRSDALRSGGRKLGLGSSAAVLVASLGAVELETRGPLSDGALAGAVYERALVAHRRAQGGGSGVDVAASTFGGTLAFHREGDRTRVVPLELPSHLFIEVWASAISASTPELLSRVRSLRDRDPALHAELMGAQARAARDALSAFEQRDVPALVQALARQLDCLGRLGDASGAGIVTVGCRELCERAERENAAVLPSGAGGGDLLLYFGAEPASPELVARAQETGHQRLELGLGARGVHGCSEGG
jgi:phosphomevalonate kinase